MKRKLLLVMISILMITLSVGLVACDEDEHTHTYSTEWSSDDTHHWRVANCEHTTEVTDKAEHSFGEEGKCSVCQKEKPTGEGNNPNDSQQQKHFTQATTIDEAIAILEAQGFETRKYTDPQMLQSYAGSIGMIEAGRLNGNKTEEIDALLFDTEVNATAFKATDTDGTLGFKQSGKWVYIETTRSISTGVSSVTEQEWNNFFASAAGMNFKYETSYEISGYTSTSTYALKNGIYYSRQVSGVTGSDPTFRLENYVTFDDDTWTKTTYIKENADPWEKRTETFDDEIEYQTSKSNYNMLGNGLFIENYSTEREGVKAPLSQLYSAFTDKGNGTLTATLYSEMAYVEPVQIVEVGYTLNFANGRINSGVIVETIANTPYTTLFTITYDGFDIVIPNEALNANGGNSAAAFTQATSIDEAIEILQNDGYQAVDVSQTSGILSRLPNAVGGISATKAIDANTEETISVIFFDTEDNALEYYQLCSQGDMGEGESCGYGGRWFYMVMVETV